MSDSNSTELVLQAVQDIHSQEQTVTRETLASLTGLSLTVIDDRIATLVDAGKVLRVQRGVFMPANQHPPARPISKTILSDGTVKVEIGDEVLTLTPREDRVLGELSAGAAHQFTSIEHNAQLAYMAQELSLKYKELRRDHGRLAAALKALESKIGGGAGETGDLLSNSSQVAGRNTEGA